MGYLITNVKVLDGTGREPFAGAVRVEGTASRRSSRARPRPSPPAPPSSMAAAPP